MFFNENDINIGSNTQYNYSRNSGPMNTDDVVTLGEWIGVIIVLALPIVNIIMYLYWAFGSNANQNLKNFARASIIMGGLALVLGVLLG